MADPSRSITNSITDPEERRRAIALIAELESRAQLVCPGCERTVCGHQYVLNAAMGFKDAPRCVACLAAALEQSPDEFLVRVGEYVHQRPCFRAAWEWADSHEGSGGSPRPECLAGFSESAGTEPAQSGTPRSTHTHPTARWDAGDMSCGDLVLELRMRLMKLSPGEILELTATDAAAPEDIPAWCKLTRHGLLQAQPPLYHIRKKGQLK